jgi:hypothetical protein
MPRLLAALALTLFWTAPAVAQDDPYRAGPLDSGKMWLFEQPPVAYLAEAYDFHPDEAWFERARLAALRLPNCSASFVSAHGLVATNHHCVRNAIVAVQRDGERLLEEGFFAADLAGERRVDGLYLDQLVAIADVTDRVERALDAAQTEAERTDAREAVFAQIQEERAHAAGPGHHAQVVSLYNGGRFSAYTFRRFEDVRLVGAPENDLGFFGGDPDNFTYPRYSLDFALLRVYGADGRPYDASQHYFRWTTEGVEEGDLVFVIGNPGSTDRGDTAAQLEFRRDVTVPLNLEFLSARIATLDAYLAANPEADAVRNQRFSLSNAQKAFLGRRDALHDPVIMARKRDAEAQFRAAVEANPTLRAEFGDLFAEMAEIQAARRTLRPEAMVFLTATNPNYSSATLRRALLAARLGTPGADDRALREAIRQVPDLADPSIERGYLVGQLAALARHTPDLGAAILEGRTPEAAADALLAGSALASAASAAAASGPLADDPAVQAARLIAPRMADFQSGWAGLLAQEQEVARGLGRARFAVYGTERPPDATFSPRFTDGVVRGYTYNGTVAPPYTTFWGVYDRHFAHAPDAAGEWALPARWLPPPPALNLAIPLNFVSTADTIGGNSGSPAVNRDLELVGINFDRTIEGLSRDYIYFADRGRNVMVDARAVTATLGAVYGADHLVEELRTGRVAVPFGTQ